MNIATSEEGREVETYVQSRRDDIYQAKRMQEDISHQTHG